MTLWLRSGVLVLAAMVPVAGLATDARSASHAMKAVLLESSINVSYMGSPLHRQDVLDLLALPKYGGHRVILADNLGFVESGTTTFSGLLVDPDPASRPTTPPTPSGVEVIAFVQNMETKEIVPAGSSMASEIVGVEDHAAPPAGVLLRAMPNPFSPRATIAFDLPKTEHVTLSVHDLRGRLVATLVDDIWAKGSHRTTWSGRDDRGQERPSGVYLARIVSGKQVVQHRLTLVR